MFFSNHPDVHVADPGLEGHAADSLWILTEMAASRTVCVHNKGIVESSQQNSYSAVCTSPKWHLPGQIKHVANIASVLVSARIGLGCYFSS